MNRCIQKDTLIIKDTHTDHVYDYKTKFGGKKTHKGMLYSHVLCLNMPQKFNHGLKQPYITGGRKVDSLKTRVTSAQLIEKLLSCYSVTDHILLHV